MKKLAGNYPYQQLSIKSNAFSTKKINEVVSCSPVPLLSISLYVSQQRIRLIEDMNDHYVLKITIAPSNIGVFPANICWSSRTLQDVLKTCLEGVLKTCLEDVLKTCLEDVLKACLEDVLKTPWRQTKCLLGISAFNHGLPANLNQYLTNLIYLINLYFTNVRRIRNALIRTQ